MSKNGVQALTFSDNNDTLAVLVNNTNGNNDNLNHYSSGNLRSINRTYSCPK